MLWLEEHGLDNCGLWSRAKWREIVEKNNGEEAFPAHLVTSPAVSSCDLRPGNNSASRYGIIRWTPVARFEVLDLLHTTVSLGEVWRRLLRDRVLSDRNPFAVWKPPLL